LGQKKLPSQSKRVSEKRRREKSQRDKPSGLNEKLRGWILRRRKVKCCRDCVSV
jgi:hypothetical protein